jgi:hypothetical protein
MILLNFLKIFNSIKGKIAESMTIEKNVNLDLKEGICTEKTFKKFVTGFFAILYARFFWPDLG